MADPLLDCDLRKLSKEDLALVRRWAEDRLINAVTPLDIRLQLEPLTRNVPVADHGDPRLSRGEIPCQGGVLACDLTCQEARRTVERILGIVEEVRALAERKAHGAERRKSDQENPDLMPLQKTKEVGI